MTCNKSMCIIKMSYYQVKKGKFLLKTTFCGTLTIVDFKAMIYRKMCSMKAKTS